MAEPRTLGALKHGGFATRSVKDEMRSNLLRKLGAGEPLFPGVLGYDDGCLTARAAGKRVTVVDVDTHHHTTVGFKSAAIKQSWDVAEAIFQAKWWGS